MLRRVKHHYKRRKAITEESQRVKKKSLIKRILRLPDYKCCIWQLLQSWTIDFQIFSSKSLSDQIYPDYILKSNQLNPLKLYFSAKMNSFQLIAQQTICVILFSCTVIKTSRNEGYCTLHKDSRVAETSEQTEMSQGLTNIQLLDVIICVGWRII